MSSGSLGSGWLTSTVSPARSRRPSPTSGLVVGIDAYTRSTSGASASRWIRSTISISIAGGVSSSSSTYQRRYAVWLHDGQSNVTWATTRGGWPSPGSP